MKGPTKPTLWPKVSPLQRPRLASPPETVTLSPATAETCADAVAAVADAAMAENAGASAAMTVEVTVAANGPANPPLSRVIPGQPEPIAPRTPSGPPPGYQPILLPGESISKYQRYQQPAQAQEATPKAITTEAELEDAEEIAAPLAASFPEDEPVFASTEAIAEPLHEEHDHASHDHSAHSEEQVESASTSVEWNREFRNPELAPPGGD